MNIERIIETLKSYKAVIEDESRTASRRSHAYDQAIAYGQAIMDIFEDEGVTARVNGFIGELWDAIYDDYIDVGGVDECDEFDDYDDDVDETFYNPYMGCDDYEL